MTHYFAERPDVGSDAIVLDVALEDVAFSLVTDRGVFSHGQVDSGTALLLRSAPPLPADGQFLDLGCGAGAIALTMALRSPDATVWAVDVNERARLLTAANAQRNGIGNVRVVGPDGVPDGLEFSTIWSNPPIRIGKQALHTMLLRWLDRLTPDGEAILVVNKHLGADSLQRWLDDQGYPAERLTSRAGYRVLCARRRGSAGRVDGDA